MTMLSKRFSDIAIYSPSTKTVRSVRDGVIEYLGSELSIEPFDKVFTVYRSPATISNVAMSMNGIPLTDEHIDLDTPAPDTGSRVEASSMVDFVDDCTKTRVAIKNSLYLTDEYVERLQNKTQLSLGYFGDLIEHNEFDFEQVNLVPHHLAAVYAGRCGELCSFLDRKMIKKEEKEMEIHKVFKDEEGQVNLEQVVDIAMSLPDAIKTLSLDELQKIMPALQEIVAMAQTNSTEENIAVEDEEIVEGEEKKDIPVEDEDKDEEKKDGEEKPKFSDADFKDALIKQSKEFADKAVKVYSEVVDKARNFLDEDYDFKGKTSDDIMKDALSTESTSKFSDAELPLAFKLLKKTAEYKKFGDHKTAHPLDEIANKEL